MIKTLLIDYAGVLTPTGNNMVFAKKYATTYGMDEKNLFDLSYTNWGETATNKQKSEIFWKQMSDKLKTDPFLLQKQVIETYPLDDRLISFLWKIKARYTLVMLSNQIESWIEEVLKTNNLNGLFDHTANSYETGYRKPSKEIFDYALKISNTSPLEALFLDDDLKNVDAAKKLGINALLYKNFADFKSRFSELIKS